MYNYITGGRIMRFAWVMCKEPECPQAARVERFFSDYVPEGAREIRYGSREADDLWDKAERHFGRRNSSKHPLVVIIGYDNNVDWACTAPNNKQLHDALRRLREMQAEKETTAK